MSSSPSPPDDIANAEMETETETEADATLASSESLQTDMPLTMAASVVLEHLPRDAHTALSKAGLLEQGKSTITSIYLSLASSITLCPSPLGT
jgi:ubiquitin-like protein ATG12